MLHKRSKSSPNIATSLAQTFQDLSLEHQQPASCTLPGLPGQPPNMTSPNSRRRLLKRQQSAITQPAKIEPDGASEIDAVPSNKSLYNEVSRRPHLLTRNSSYSKRHASFESPREVPLPPSPLPSLQRRNPVHQANTATHSGGPKGKGVDQLSSIETSRTYPVFEHATDDSSEASSSFPSASSAPTSPSSCYPSDFTDARLKPTHTSSRNPNLPGDHQPRDIPEMPEALALTQGASPVFPFSRPYSLPDAHSNSCGAATMPVPSSTNPGWPDRTSCASLPLPMQTPYFILPTVPPLEEAREFSQPVPTGPPAADRPTKSRPEAKMPDKMHTLRSGQRPPYEQSSPSATLSPTAIRPATSSILSCSSSLSHTSGSYPPPTPPTILAPSPPPMETRAQAPYEPFLSHAPPPEDSWIVVETTQTDYALVVRLPGFKRDGITLATRRRRILHVVADSWEPSGGHFERRISFGYDADLTQVRAEFDGELLRIVIPRRIPPMNAWGRGQGGRSASARRSTSS